MLSNTQNVKMKEEKQLVKQCKKHSHKAFDRLYDAYSPVLFGICLRYARDASSAQDILQEAFLTIFNKIEGYRFEGSFEGWLKRITVNTAINYLRKQNRQSFSSLDDGYHEYSAAEADNIVGGMSEQEILQHIQTLPDGYRTIFNLFVIEGYKHVEIAKMLNITESTSRTQLAKARKVLQRKLMENK